MSINLNPVTKLRENRFKEAEKVAKITQRKLCWSLSLIHIGYHDMNNCSKSAIFLRHFLNFEIIIAKRVLIFSRIVSSRGWKCLWNSCLLDSVIK